MSCSKTNLCSAFGIALVCWCVPVAAQQVEVQEKSPTETNIAETNASDSAIAGSESVVAPAKASDVAEPVVAGKAVTREYEFAEAKQRMSYRLYLPEGYYEKLIENKDAKFPLIVALHGYGSSPSQIVGYPSFTRYANENQYIIVAPMGFNRTGWYGSRGAGGGRGSDPKNLGELSEKDVMNVLDLTRKEFPIDDNRIYLYGHSMGGGGAIYLGAKYPGIWAAIAPMAPAIPKVPCNLEDAKHIPVFMVHGDDDRVLPVKSARRWVEELKKTGVPHEYIEVKDGDHVTVAFRYFEEIFKFFEQNPKRTQPLEKPPTPPSGDQDIK